MPQDPGTVHKACGHPNEAFYSQLWQQEALTYFENKTKL